MSELSHVPVLLEEVIESLCLQPGGTIIDATVGQGGHARAIMSRILPEGRLLGIDRDETNLAIAKQHLIQFGEAVVLVHDSYANVTTRSHEHGISFADGILLDLGFSSAHIDDETRGFSFLGDAPLDMRYDRRQECTADLIVNTYSEDDLARVFRVYGEEPDARNIAQAIVAARPVHTTAKLATLVETLKKRRGKTHPATRVFQALRIEVNNELGELEEVLPQLVNLLSPNGRLAIISFHSLEDRIVKQFFKKTPELECVNTRVITPKETELKQNPRARSAKLRVAQRK